MNSKEYGQSRRPSRGPKKYDEKGTSERGYAGKRSDAGERGGKRFSDDRRGAGPDAGFGAKRFATGARQDGGTGGKRFATGARQDSGTGGKRFTTGARQDGGFGGKRFTAGGRQDTGFGGKRFATGEGGKRAGTGRTGRSSGPATGGRFGERPERRGTDRPSRGEKDARFAGERRYKDTGRTPDFKPRRKDLPAKESYSARPVERNDLEIEEREDRIEGRNPVLEALRSERPLNKIFMEKDNPDATLAKIAAMAREKSVPVQYVERRKLDAMSSTRIHQGVILEAAAHEYVEVEDILKVAADKNEDPFIVILDGITDTNNFGSIIRSAECAGVHGIIIPKRRSATLNATVAKVAAGAQEYVAIARVANLTQAVRELKKQGVWITAADLDGERPFYESDLNGPVALVIGSEGEGISKVVKDECDYLVKIPMKGKISSLNAGVAAGLIMFEISKRRG